MKQGRIIDKVRSEKSIYRYARGADPEAFNATVFIIDVFGKVWLNFLFEGNGFGLCKDTLFGGLIFSCNKWVTDPGERKPRRYYFCFNYLDEEKYTGSASKQILFHVESLLFI